MTEGEGRGKGLRPKHFSGVKGSLSGTEYYSCPDCLHIGRGRGYFFKRGSSSLLDYTTARSDPECYFGDMDSSNTGHPRYLAVEFEKEEEL